MPTSPFSILALGPHPDDVELGVGGSLLLAAANGAHIHIVDATRGETSTNGTSVERAEEARLAGILLGASSRTNLGIPSNQIDPGSLEQRRALARVVRMCKPDVLLCPYSAPLGHPRPTEIDRHPDHRNLSQLVGESLHLSGLAKVSLDGYEAWRPKKILYYGIHAQLPACSVVVDITSVWDRKLEAILVHRSQFIRDGNRTPTALNAGSFIEVFEAGAKLAGARIGVRYAEPFYSEHPLALKNLADLL